jgi:hypothetical protein
MELPNLPPLPNPPDSGVNLPPPPDLVPTAPLPGSGNQLPPSNLPNLSQTNPPNLKKWGIISGGVVGMIILLAGSFYLYKHFTGRNDIVSDDLVPAGLLSNNQNNNITPGVNTPTPDLQAMYANNPDISRWSVDTDGDQIPDFIETEMKTDPNTTVEDVCIQANTKDCGNGTTGSSEMKKTNILVIFDASGSMAQKVGSVSKIDAAKSAVKRFIDSLNNENMNISLMVYGHKGSNSQSDKTYSCSQIDVIYPLGPLDKNQFKNVIDTFSPTGWTPIAGALDKAPGVFVGQEGQNNHIILISDGLEQCDGNPVQSAQKLKDSSFKLIVDIIGFNIASSDQAQLKNIATATGGNFINATNEEEIYNDLKTRNENWFKLMQYGNCLWWNGTLIGNCIYNAYVDAGNYLYKNYVNKVSYNEKDPVKVLGEKLGHDLAGKLMDLSGKSAQTYWDNASKQGKEQWNKADTQLKK